MLDIGQIKKGLKIEIDSEPYIVAQFEFSKPGKGKAHYKCKLKNMITGTQIDKTFRSGEKIQETNLEEREMEYLYSDKEGYCFMDTSSYEQLFLSEDNIGDAKSFLKENTLCKVLFFDNKAIGITLPNFVDLKIIESPPWSKGDTASGDSKPVELETNITVQVPPFIEEGEYIKIDTRTGQYVERVKK